MGVWVCRSLSVRGWLVLVLESVVLWGVFVDFVGGFGVGVVSGGV